MGNAPHNIMPIAPDTSSARKISSSSAMIGSNPKEPKTVVKMPVKYSITASTNTILSVASITRPNTMNPLIMASGLNLSPNASATHMMISGTRLTPIWAKLNAS